MELPGTAVPRPARRGAFTGLGTATGLEHFLQIRMGSTPQKLCLTLEPAETPPLAQPDPIAASGLHRLLSTHATQPGLPASVALPAWGRIEVTGEAEQARSLARAMVAHAALMHSPEDLVIAALVSREARPEWEWLKWLPHAQSTRQKDALGQARMVSDSLAELFSGSRTMWPTARASRRVPPSDLTCCSSSTAAASSRPSGRGRRRGDGVTVLDLPDQWGELDSPHTLRLAVGVAPVVRDDQGPPMEVIPHPAICARHGRPAVCRGGRGCRSSAGSALHRRRVEVVRDNLSATSDLLELLGLGDVRDYDPEQAWRPRLQRDRLRVPIGIDDSGAPVALDIKGIGPTGHGPHGLIIGATGSGKSEVLRTLVLALSLTHSSEALNFVLVDFKGGATFAGWLTCPHVSAVITNLGQRCRSWTACRTPWPEK